MTSGASASSPPSRAQAASAIENLWSLGIPTTPPQVSREESAAGLALMDLSLRMNHVARISERLTYRESTHLARDISMDLDVSALTPDQLSALKVPSTGAAAAGGSPTHVWLPIARQPRSDIAPVVVQDAGGAVLSRLTALQIAKSLSAGLIRLFRMLLDAHPDTRISGTALHGLKHRHNRARWLIEMSIAHAVDENGSRHFETISQSSLEATTRPPVRDAAPGQSAPLLETDSFSIRQAAESGVRTLLGGDDHPFFQLIEFTLREQFLVVQAPLADPRLFLKYDLPRLSPHHDANPLSRWLRGFRPDSGVIVGTFTTEVPRDVESYHLELEVDEEVQVSRFTLCTDADGPLVTSIVQDSSALAESLDVLRTRPDPLDTGATSRKLLEAELQSIASRLCELARRRSADRARYQEYYESTLRGVRSRPETPPMKRMDRNQALAALDASGFPLAALVAFAGHYHADAYRQLAFSDVGADTLGNIARRLTALELSHDVTSDNDPREHGAHAHWRPRFVELSRRTAEPIRAQATFVLTDESPSLMASVIRFAGCLAALVAFVGTVATGSVVWLTDWRPGTGTQIEFENSDAVVAALLLVPGLLATRLALPRTNSVLHELRAYQTRIAYSAIAVTSALALTVAGASEPTRVLWAFRLAVLVILLLLASSAWEALLRRNRRRRPVPLVAEIPAWLRLEMAGDDLARVKSHVSFDGVGRV